MSGPSQHATLTAERWAGFGFAQRVLMIANEMNRASKLMGAGDETRLRNAYERVLNLADLSIAVADRPAMRRELLRWRDLVAALYVALAPDPAGHSAAFRALLMLTPEAARQVPYVLP